MKLKYLTRVPISIGIAVAALNVIVMALIFPRLEEGLKELDTLEFAPLNLSQLTDGDYEGNFAAGIVGAAVIVVVSGHEIKSTEIVRHNHGRGKLAETIIASLIENQSVEVCNLGRHLQQQGYFENHRECHNINR
ncbi:FMN-binding protein [Mesotoga sp. UBA5825]|uniref:FMN-binding protein n=1 Tax=Mesotoga sp. UBA5825 TaxID=1946858 RepID=UPI0025F287FC|nr:FMN-binding protein [Mesotoga sp. UBA5825]